MEVVVAQGQDGVHVHTPGTAEVLTEAGFAGRVRQLEAQHPRWVWADTATLYPALLDAGVRVERCHDLRLCRTILHRAVGDGAAENEAAGDGTVGDPDATAHATSAVWDTDDTAADAPATPTLFGAPAPSPDEVLAEHRRQRASRATILDRAHHAGRSDACNRHCRPRREASLRGMIVDGSTAMSPGVWARSVVTLATVVLVATWAAIWWLVVPMEAVCPAIYPAPPGCTGADRRSAGVTWTVIVAVVYALCVSVSLTLGRGRRWLTHAAMLALVFVAIIGIGAVQGSTGSVIWY